MHELLERFPRVWQESKNCKEFSLLDVGNQFPVPDCRSPVVQDGLSGWRINEGALGAAIVQQRIERGQQGPLNSVSSKVRLHEDDLHHQDGRAAPARSLAVVGSDAEGREGRSRNRVGRKSSILDFPTVHISRRDLEYLSRFFGAWRIDRACGVST